MRIFSLFIVITWLSVQAATAGQTFAVVVGISDYQALSDATGDLRYADRDARQIVRFLQSKAGGYVPASNIQLLTNRQATWANIQRALLLFRQAGPNDRVILYFSGHGTANSFVPYDVSLQNPENLLTHSAVKAAFHESKAKTKLCVADACLSGAMTQSSQSRNLAKILANNVGSGSNVAMLLASRSTESAIEAGRLEGGAFTYYLLKGLSGQADLDRNKIVTIRELHQYVSPHVRQLTRGRQAPVFYGRFPDSLPLAYL